MLYNLKNEADLIVKLAKCNIINVHRELTIDTNK